LIVEIQIGEHSYTIGKLTAMQQFHVARKLAPLLGSFVSKAKSAGIEGKQDREELFADMVLGPMAEAIAGMSDETAEFIIFNCLSVVKRKEGSVLSPVKGPGNTLMYQDLDFTDMLRIVVEVIKQNLATFFFEAQKL
jgi:hypothetical protein